MVATDRLVARQSARRISIQSSVIQDAARIVTHRPFRVLRKIANRQSGYPSEEDIAFAKKRRLPLLVVRGRLSGKFRDSLYPQLFEILGRHAEHTMFLLADDQVVGVLKCPPDKAGFGHMVLGEDMGLCGILADVFQDILIRSQRLGNLVLSALKHQHPGIEESPFCRRVKGEVYPMKNDDCRILERDDTQTKLRTVGVDVVIELRGHLRPVNQIRELIRISHERRSSIAGRTGYV